MTRTGTPAVEFERIWTWVEGGLLSSLETAPLHGCPILLVPGLAMSARYLQPLAAVLATHHPVSILELPGSGRSEAPPGVRSMRAQADAIAEWLAAAAARLRIGRARSLPHGPHCVHYSHPDLTADAIRAWIAAAALPRPDARPQPATR